MVAVNSLTNRIYVTNSDDDNVSVIDGVTDSVIDVIMVGDHPYGVDVNTETNMVYVTNWWENFVSVIDGSTNSVIDTVWVKDNWFEGICVNPEINHIYATNRMDDYVSVIDGETNLVIATIGVGYRPVDIATNSQNNMIYVSCYYDGTIWVLHDGGSGVEEIFDAPQMLSIDISLNPFNETTQLVLNIPADYRGEDAKFLIYNVSGRLVKKFSDINSTSSTITLSWDGKTDSGKDLSSGLYFGVLKYGEDEIQKKIIMIR